jgi:hypothetical protein
MINYVCYNCDYATSHKTRMQEHLERKNKCKSSRNININDCKEYILRGILYKEYLSIIGNKNNYKQKDLIDEYKKQFIEIIKSKDNEIKELKNQLNKLQRKKCI